MKDNQRKAMFARMKGLQQMGFSQPSAKFYAQKGISAGEVKNSSFKQLQRKGIWLKYQGDKDNDGVKNVKDCKPLNPKKQGIIHDVQMKLLKRKEERMEMQREKQQKRLNDLKDELAIKRRISNKELGIKQSENAAKQKIADQIKDEERKKAQLDAEARKAKQEMDKYTWTGKTKTFLKAKGGNIKKRWNSEEGRANRAKAAKIAKSGFKKLWKQIS